MKDIIEFEKNLEVEIDPFFRAAKIIYNHEVYLSCVHDSACWHAKNTHKEILYFFYKRYVEACSDKEKHERANI